VLDEGMGSGPHQTKRDIRAGKSVKLAKVKFPLNVKMRGAVRHSIATLGYGVGPYSKQIAGRGKLTASLIKKGKLLKAAKVIKSDIKQAVKFKYTTPLKLKYKSLKGKLKNIWKQLK
jgi:hypothetical protein